MCGCPSHAPNWGPGLHATQVCALTGNRTSDPLVHRPALSPLSYTSQGNRNSFNEVMQQMEDDGFVVSAVKER